MVDIAISAPARSIDAAATSTSRRLMTSRIFVPCTSTSYIDTSSVSGSMPWLIVRLPWGSRSTHNARWPRSTNAAARLSVVVVLATPPFWLAKAMTCALEFVMGALFSRSSANPSHNLPPIAALFEKRLVFVTGKGGVGKTTVSLALGLAAARRGLRTIVCEVAHQERFSRLMGREGVGYEEAEIAENLSAISLDQQHTLEEWVTYQLPSKTLAGMLYRNGIFQHLTSAAPGIKELVTIGKIWELSQLHRKTKDARPYDFVVVDSPATGHGLGMLRAPRTFADIARVGPIRHQADRIHDFIVSNRTGVLAVALPEEMPVNETLDYRQELVAFRGDLDSVVMNGLYPARFTAEEIDTLNGRDGAAVRAAVTEYCRYRSQVEELERLKDGVGSVPVASLPFMFAPELGLEEVTELSHEFEEQLT